MSGFFPDVRPDIRPDVRPDIRLDVRPDVNPDIRWRVRVRDKVSVYFVHLVARNLAPLPGDRPPCDRRRKW
jgi:hypothetical protein